MSSEFTLRTLALLHFMERHASTSEQHDALANSRLILQYILARNEGGAFEAYLKAFNTEPQRALLSFATKDLAEAWLRAHPAPPHGALVGVGDALFQVAYVRELEHRKLLSLPSQEEWGRMQEDEEEYEGEAEEEPRPPSPRPGTPFSLFDLLLQTSHHLHELEPRVSSPEEREALRVARVAFHFVMQVGEDHGFEEYLRTLDDSTSPRPRLSFATREEAESWLMKQPEPPPAAVVVIGGELYSVGYNRIRSQRVLLRIPAQPPYP